MCSGRLLSEERRRSPSSAWASYSANESIRHQKVSFGSAVLSGSTPCVTLWLTPLMACLWPSTWHVPVQKKNLGQLITRSCELARTTTQAAKMRAMSVEEFRDRDAEHLGWVAAHRDGYVINIGRSEQGYARLHRATCGTMNLGYAEVCEPSLGRFLRTLKARFNQWRGMRPTWAVPPRGRQKTHNPALRRPPRRRANCQTGSPQGRRRKELGQVPFRRV